MTSLRLCPSGSLLALLVSLAACAGGRPTSPMATGDSTLAELAKPPSHRRDDGPQRPDRHVLDVTNARIVAYADPSLLEEVEVLFAQLRDFDEKGMEFSDGFALPFAWTTLTLKDLHGELVFHEPDYQGDPEGDLVEGVHRSLAVLHGQLALIDALRIRPAPVDFDEHVLVARGALERDSVYLVRVESPGGRLTGWRVANDDLVGEGMEVDSIPVHAVLKARPELLECMLLPAGYMAFYEKDELVSVIDPGDREVWNVDDGPNEESADEAR